MPTDHARDVSDEPEPQPQASSDEHLESRQLSADELAESKRYGLHSLVCDLIDMALDLAYLSLAAFVLAVPLADWLEATGVVGRGWRLLALFLLLTLGHYLVSFPLSVYSGHLLEHRFGLSRQSFSRWFARYCLKSVLVLLLGAAMTQALFCTIWWFGASWWLLAAGMTFLVSVLIGQWMPVLILPLFYKVEKLDDEELVRRFAGLVAGTTLRIEGVYRMVLSNETVKANAMLAGLGKTRRVILGDTLLDQFTADEIEVVLAHEVGHHVHHHFRKLIVLGIITSTLGFLICDLVIRGATAGPVDYGQLEVAYLPLLMLVITLSSLVIGPFQNGLSRHFERQCDRYALDQTGKSGAFQSAFQKLARLNKSDPDPPRLEVLLFHDHPPIAERLAMASGGGDVRG